MRSLTKTIVVSLIVMLAILLTANTWSYLNFDPQYGFLKLKQKAIATGWYLPAYYAHILAGGLILLAGLVQFNQSVRIQNPRLHRILGLLYVYGILLLAAPGGFVMAMFINRGLIVLASFILQCSFWAYFTTIAFQKALRRNYSEHEMWMMRGYSLTLAAITLRLYIFIASFWLDLTNPLAYGIFAWLSWVPNLLVAEILIRKRLQPVAR